MADVQFTEEQQHTPIAQVSKPEGLTGFVIRLGLAKDERSATFVLVCVLVASLLLTGVLFFTGGSSEPPPRLPDMPIPGGRAR